MDLIKRANDLVLRKGEMSVELWNDKAQCLLAPICHKIETLFDALSKDSPFIRGVEARAWLKAKIEEHFKG